MKKTLKALQALQTKAFQKGIHSFIINTRYFEPDEEGDPREPGICVTIFRKGNGEDDDYYSRSFYRPSKYGLAEIAEFIGENPEEYVQA